LTKVDQTLAKVDYKLTKSVITQNVDGLHLLSGMSQGDSGVMTDLVNL
jgi:NAD-dependent SIR2 family protein deacetylase